MPRRRTASAVSEGRIDEADRASKRKRSVGTSDVARGQMLLHNPQTRVVPLPEPVDVPQFVNWREPEPWEAGLVVEARHRERRAELELFRGLIG